jgi:hypothetical protein
MPGTLLSSLSSTLKLTAREEIARFLGESEQAVTRGFEFATAALFDGLHRQTGQSEVMRQVIELASKAPADVGAALNASQLGNPNSPLILGGKKVSLLRVGTRPGSNSQHDESRVGVAAGIRCYRARPDGQCVLSFIGSRVRNEGMTATSLAMFLQRTAASPCW